MSIYRVQRSDFPFAVDLVSILPGVPDLMKTLECGFIDPGNTLEHKYVFDQLAGYFSNLSDGELSGVRMAVIGAMHKGSVKHVVCFESYAQVLFTHGKASYAMTIAPLAMQPLQSLIEVDDAFSSNPKNWGKVDNSVDDPSTRIPF